MKETEKTLDDIFCSLNSTEKELVLVMLLTKGNKSKAAEMISMNRNRYSALFDFACDKIKTEWEHHKMDVSISK